MSFIFFSFEVSATTFSRFYVSEAVRENLLQSPSGPDCGRVRQVLPCVNHTPGHIQVEPIHHLLAVTWAALPVNLEKIMYFCCEMTSHNEIVIFRST